MTDDGSAPTIPDPPRQPTPWTFLTVMLAQILVQLVVITRVLCGQRQTQKQA